MNRTATNPQSHTWKLNLTGWSYVGLILAEIALGGIWYIQVRRSRNDLILDPERPYSAGGERGHNYLPMFTENPLPWIILGLFVVMIGVTIYRARILSTFESIDPAIAIPAGIFAVIAMFIACFGYIGSADRVDQTFSIWAEQRYGIEIEHYPTTGPGLLAMADTEAPITLDDGQTVQMQKLTDARGNSAYVIAPAEGSAKELDIIAG